MASDAPSIFATYGIRELPGHRDKVYTLAWSRDGRRLASGSLDKTIMLWSIEPRILPPGKVERPQSELKGHSGDVVDLAWDPSRQDSLASASTDKTVRLWDIKSGKSVATIPTSGSNLYICYHPKDTNTILSVCLGSGDSTVINIIDVRKGSVTNKQERSYEVNEIAFSKDGRFLFQTSGSGGIEVYTWPDMKKVFVLEGHTDTSYSLALDPVGPLLGSGGEDGLVLLWDVVNMSNIGAFSGNDQPVRHLSISYDSHFLAFGGDEQNVIIIQPLGTGEPAYRKEVPARIDSLSWSPITNLLAFTGSYIRGDPHSRSYRGNVGIFAPPSYEREGGGWKAMK